MSPFYTIACCVRIRRAGAYGFLRGVGKDTPVDLRSSAIPMRPNILGFLSQNYLGDRSDAHDALPPTASSPLHTTVGDSVPVNSPALAEYDRFSRQFQHLTVPAVHAGLAAKVEGTDIPEAVDAPIPLVAVVT